jgi:hypothetical protein
LCDLKTPRRWRAKSHSRFCRLCVLGKLFRVRDETSFFFFAELKWEKGEIVIAKGGNPKSLSGKTQKSKIPSMKHFSLEKSAKNFSPAALLSHVLKNNFSMETKKEK